MTNIPCSIHIYSIYFKIYLQEPQAMCNPNIKSYHGDPLTYTTLDL